MVRVCWNCKYFALNGGHCLIKLASESLEQICNYHEFTRGALEKQARLNIELETNKNLFQYADTDSVTIIKG